MLVLLGATATGKSDLAMRLAGRLGGEIVNADALQAYRHLDIGTGKPRAAERARVPHHLLDVLDPSERYSAGEFARRGRRVVDEVHARGQVPIVVGGSGLYLRALLEGLSPLPRPDAAVRAELRERLTREGLAVLRTELERRDPVTAARLPAGDTQRVLRALEVAIATGVGLSRWIAERPSDAPSFQPLRVGLTLPRSVLYDRIEVRVRAMLAAGWMREVQSLLAAGFDPRSPAFQAIGYRQLVECLRRGGSERSVEAEIVTATRRLAKRQETWFRRERDVHWLDATDAERLQQAAWDAWTGSERGRSA